MSHSLVIRSQLPLAQWLCLRFLLVNGMFSVCTFQKGLRLPNSPKGLRLRNSIVCTCDLAELTLVLQRHL